MIAYLDGPASRALALGLAALLAGCSMAPAYRRPDVQIPSTLVGDASPVASASPAPVELTADERAFLHAFAPDRDLQPLVAKALARNADYRLAALQVEQARAQYRIERSARLPTVAIGAAQSRQRFDDKELDQRYQQDLVTTSAGIEGFELDFFGRIKSLSEAARERYLASTYGRQAARGALIGEVLRAYVLERAADEAQASARAIEDDNEALLAIAVRQHEVGLLARDELDRRRARTDQARTSAQQAGDDRRAALRALQVLAGYDVVPDAGGLAALAAPGASLPALRDLDSKVLLQRPDIQQAEAELRAANADIGAARAAFFPSIRLSTSLGTASGDLSGLFDGGSRMWSFMPQLTLPIFDFGRNRANLDLAWTRRQAGVAEYEKTIQAAFREVADALDAQATLGQANARQGEEAARAQQRAERLSERADHGLADRTDLLEIRMQAAQAALDSTQARRDAALNRVALFRAFYGVALSTPL